MHISKLRKKNAANKANNKAINKIAEDFEKNSCSDKIKRIKTICQKYFTKIQKIKNTQSEIKPITIRKRLGTTYYLGCKDYTQNFKPAKVKITNKVLREKSQCCLLIK